LVAGGWFVLREKYCWLVADKPNEQGDSRRCFEFCLNGVAVLDVAAVGQRGSVRLLAALSELYIWFVALVVEKTPCCL
jgi:hypothetical protein